MYDPKEMTNNTGIVFPIDTDDIDDSCASILHDFNVDDAGQNTCGNFILISKDNNDNFITVCSP